MDDLRLWEVVGVVGIWVRFSAEEDECLVRLPMDFTFLLSSSVRSGLGFGLGLLRSRKGDPGVPEPLPTKRDTSSPSSPSEGPVRGVPLKFEVSLEDSGVWFVGVAVADMEDILGGAFCDGVRCSSLDVIW